MTPDPGGRGPEAPVIIDYDPKSGFRDSTVVTINGENLGTTSEQNLVLFAGIPSQTVEVPPGQEGRQIKATVPEEVPIGLARLSVKVHGQESNKVLFHVIGTRTYRTGEHPRSMDSGDLNNDGHPDLVVLNWGSYADPGEPGISVFLGRDDGTFEDALFYATEQEVGALALAHFNGDGYLDVAVTYGIWTDDPENSGISVFLGKGDGSFRPASQYRSGPRPRKLAIGDLDADGNSDLIVGADDIYVLLGKEDGTFHDAERYPFVSGIASFAIEDVDDDGNLDLAVLNFLTHQVIILRGTGNGDFQDSYTDTYKDAYSFDAGYFPGAMAMDDLDGDGDLDILVGDSHEINKPENSNGLLVYLGNGDGTFQFSNSYPIHYPVSFAIGDLDSDDKLDLAVEVLNSNGSHHIAVLLGRGDGTFDEADTLSAAAGPYRVTMEHFDGDGNLDLAVMNGNSDTVSIFMGRGDGSFVTAPRYYADPFPTSLAMGDLDADGNLDLVTINSNPLREDTISVLLGKDDGSFQIPLTHPAGPRPTTLAMDYLNADNYLDLVIGNNGYGPDYEHSLSVLLGNGDGSFHHIADNLSEGFWAFRTISFADLDEDGILDLITGETGWASVLLGRGDGDFQGARFVLPTISGPVTVADLDRDGNLDLAAVNLRGVSVLLGNGDGSFRLHLRDYPAGLDDSVSFAIDDLDMDGILDLAVVIEGDFPDYQGSVSVLLGKGDGSFFPYLSYPVGSRPSSVVVTDLDSNGIPDLVVVNTYSSDISLLLGKGGGIFENTFNLGVGINPNSLAAGDLDGDGVKDLVVACGSSELYVFIVH